MDKTIYNAGEDIPDHLDYAYIMGDFWDESFFSLGLRF